MDAALQAYGTLDELVNFAFENGFLLDTLPTVGAPYVVAANRGDSSVIQFVAEREWVFNDAGVEEAEFLLANPEDNLIAEVNVKIKYK